MNKVQLNTRGASKISLLVTVLFLGAVVYLGGQVANFYYSYYELEGLIENQARKAQVFKDSEMRETIMNRIKELQIPIEDPEEIRINRIDGSIIIETSYDEVLFVEFGDKVYDLHVFHFAPRIEVEI
jgi:hypothetical protein